jgi:transglutaminase-like putative cysteine protease
VQVPGALLGAATLLWGWHQDLLPHALLAALLLEAARFARFRWDFSDTDFHRVGDVSGLGLLLLALVQFSDHGLTGIYGVLRWFPLVVITLTLAQLYSTRSAVKLSAMFLSVRYALRRGRISDPGELDMRLPYLVACLLSASAGLERSPWLLPALAALLVWLLWANRPRPRPVASVIAALLVCAAVALLTAESVGTLRRALGPVIMDIVRERVAHWRDPFRNHTALGDIGRLKLSDRIVARIESAPGVPVPRLLHEASYTHLSNTVWLAGAARFRPQEPLGEGTRWDLAPDQRPFRTVTIAKSLIRNKGMLPVPAGTFRIEELPVEELEISAMGAIKVLNGPALVRFRVRYADTQGIRSSPGDDDVAVPGKLEAVLARTLDSLALEASAAPEQVAAALLRHFNDSFRYSLDLERREPAMHPVEEFLEHTRSGHCEFFATASVLLLRAAGIPARYATGYAVQEYSPLEQAWRVRRRHAHAWASAWIGGRWVDVDTTPVQWIADDASGAAWWQPVYDLLSWSLHQLSRWRLERIGAQRDQSALLWLLAPLSLVLAWRIYRSHRVARATSFADGPAIPRQSDRLGTDSEFYRIESMLERHGLTRPADCTPRAWLAQLAREARLPPGAERWDEIVALHYRLRFGPGGLDRGQRARLAEAVQRWLERAGDEDQNVSQVTPYIP